MKAGLMAEQGAFGNDEPLKWPHIRDQGGRLANFIGRPVGPWIGRRGAKKLMHRITETPGSRRTCRVEPARQCCRIPLNETAQFLCRAAPNADVYRGALLGRPAPAAPAG